MARTSLKGSNRKGGKAVVRRKSVQLRLKTPSIKQQLAQREAELAIINSVQEGLASKLDMHAIYELVGEKIRTTFNAQVVSIDTYDRAIQSLHSRYYFEGGMSLPGTTYPFFGFRKHVIENRQLLVINSDMSRWMEEYNNPVNLGSQPKSAIFVPMIVGDEAMGVISLQNNDQENAFSESDVRLLGILANSMVTALENARLFGETQQRNAELAIINSVQEGLASKLDMQAIYDLVGDKLRQIFAADTTFIVFHDKERNLLVASYYADKNLRRSFSRPYGTGVAEAIIDSGKPLRLGTEQEHEKYNPHHVVSPGAGKDLNQSVLGAPIYLKGQAYGAVSVQSYQVNAFTENDLRLLQTLANSMSVALENARLWEQEKEYRKALERELEIGREIQAGFLPETLPHVEGWEVAASLMSAREVAGDFYDAFELPDGNIGLVIADVCDKGVGAALFMTLFRSLIRATANLEYFEHTEGSNSPRSTHERLKRAVSLTNNYIAETHGDSGMFATLFFGILDPHTGKLVYINGGHEPPLILQSGIVRETLHKTGPAVGAIIDGHFDLGETQLQAGDTFFAFTDGVPDCKNPRGDFYGRGHLLNLLQCASDSSHELLQTIEADLRQYIAGATQFDDITLLAVRKVS
jgi:serine phosphatase RsbU (regulator of sigma subunit)